MSASKTLFHRTGKLISPEELFNAAHQYAEKSLRTKGSITPTLFGVTPTGYFIHYGEPFRNSDEKARFATSCSLLLLVTGARHCMLAVEGWMTQAQAGRPPQTPPSKSQDRVEVVIFCAEGSKEPDTKERNVRMTIYSILRTTKGAFEGFGENVLPENLQLGGLFANLLLPYPPVRIAKQVIQAARAVLDQMGVAVPEIG